MNEYTYDDYAQALEGAGRKVKDAILDMASKDPDISPIELRKLESIAYPDTP